MVPRLKNIVDDFTIPLPRTEIQLTSGIYNLRELLPLLDITPKSLAIHQGYIPYIYAISDIRTSGYTSVQIKFNSDEVASTANKPLLLEEPICVEPSLICYTCFYIFLVGSGTVSFIAHAYAITCSSIIDALCGLHIHANYGDRIWTYYAGEIHVMSYGEKVGKIYVKIHLNFKSACVKDANGN
jgi:hypothetical protein